MDYSEKMTNRNDNKKYLKTSKIKKIVLPNLKSFLPDDLETNHKIYKSEISMKIKNKRTISPINDEINRNIKS